MDTCQHDFYQTEEVKFDENLKQQLVKFICKKCGQVKWETVDKIFHDNKYDSKYTIVDGY